MGRAAGRVDGGLARRPQGGPGPPRPGAARRAGRRQPAGLGQGRAAPHRPAPAGPAPSAVLVVRRLQGGLPRSVTAPAARSGPRTAAGTGSYGPSWRPCSPRPHGPAAGACPPTRRPWSSPTRPSCWPAWWRTCWPGSRRGRWWWRRRCEAGGADVAGLLGRRVGSCCPARSDLLQRWDLAWRPPAGRPGADHGALDAADRIARPRTRSWAGHPGSAAGAGRRRGSGPPARRRGGDRARRPLGRRERHYAAHPWSGGWGQPSARGSAPQPALLLATALLLHRPRARPGRPSSLRPWSGPGCGGRLNQGPQGPGHPTSQAGPATPTGRRSPSRHGGVPGGHAGRRPGPGARP